VVVAVRNSGRIQPDFGRQTGLFGARLDARRAAAAQDSILEGWGRPQDGPSE